MAKIKKKNKKLDFLNPNYKKIEITELVDPIFLDGKNIIGTDETGVCDYLTPLVAAAVFVDHKNIDKLISLGVKDSKEIKDKKIPDLYFKIKDLIKYRISHLTQKGFNNLSKYMNGHELKMFLHLKSITQLEKIDKVDEDLILIDQFSTISSIEKYYHNLMNSKLKTDEIQKKVVLTHKAENIHVSVACASIVARHYFLLMMKEQEEECQMKFPLGTNKEVEKVAVEFCEKFGRKALYEIAKISFKTTKKVDQILKNKTSDSVK